MAADLALFGENFEKTLLNCSTCLIRETKDLRLAPPLALETLADVLIMLNLLLGYVKA